MAAIDSTVLARTSRSGPIRFRYAAESESLKRRRARADAEEGVTARFRIHAIPETEMHDLERDIRDIPLFQLELSLDNVRKTPADVSAFTELKASIAAHGLLENLIACSMGPGADGIARYAVIAGGRRLAAMQALAAEGALEEDHPVPCAECERLRCASLRDQSRGLVSARSDFLGPAHRTLRDRHA